MESRKLMRIEIIAPILPGNNYPLVFNCDYFFHGSLSIPKPPVSHNHKMGGPERATPVGESRKATSCFSLGRKPQDRRYARGLAPEGFGERDHIAKPIKHTGASNSQIPSPSLLVDAVVPSAF